MKSSLATAGLLVAAALTCFPAKAQQGKSAQELLDELNRVAPSGRSVQLPAPKGMSVDGVTMSPGLQGGRSRALENLKDEEANRTQRQILEKLPP